MAVSARTILELAFKDIGVLAGGEPLTAEQGQEGLARLNNMVSSWQAHMLVINGKRIQQKQDGDDKAGSKLVAAYHGAVGCGGDESDAVCLCLYGPVARSREAVKEEAKREARVAKQKAYREKRRAGK